jgi:arylformamidase
MVPHGALDVYDTRVRLIDVSVPIRPGLVVWPGDPEVHVDLASAIADGDEANVTRLALSAHAGTHVDAPSHFFEDAGTTDELSLDALVGPCVVVDATAARGELGPEALDGVESGIERVLFKTRNSELWEREGFVEGAVELGQEGAHEVVRRGIRLVGIDYLSIGGNETHRTLLAAGVVPLESLDLRGVEPGAYRLVCLPLRLAGADGAPARAILIHE